MPYLTCNIPAYVTPKSKQLFLRMMNRGANQVISLRQTKQPLKVHPIAFNSFSISCEEIITNIMDNE